MTFAPKHIFAPVAVGPSDDMSLAEHLVDAACDLVQSAGKGGRLTLAYAVPSPTTFLGIDTGFAPPSYYQAVGEMIETNRAFATKQLKALIERAAGRGVRASAELLEPVEGVGEAVAHAAKTQDADLIVLWSHGRRGIERLFLGSVAERVAHLAAMPVLLLRTT